MKHQFEMETYSVRESGFFSQLMMDYVESDKKLQPLVGAFPSYDALLQKADQRKQYPLNRQVLVNSLRNQYQSIGFTSDLLEASLTQLEKDQTFTVTTGHQLNIFGGPLYIVYKIVDVLKLASELNAKTNDKHFVPVFWMATEDHDFEEIASAKVLGKSLTWNRSAGGAVGRMPLEGFEDTLAVYVEALGLGVYASELKAIFKKAYSGEYNLAQATRYWVSQLFKDTPLVIIDGDDTALKQLFIPTMEKELKERVVQSSMEPTNTFLLEHYHVQVNPREINLFYLSDQSRERIISIEDGYATADGVKTWTDDDIFSELHESPENFSPNALMRPMYQECILPNVSYAGGGGEMAYWLQEKASFEAFDLSFPILLLRNSWHFIEEKVLQRLASLEVTGTNLFSDRQEWEKAYVKKREEESLDISQAKQQFMDHLASISDIAKNWDQKMDNAIAAEQARIEKSFKRLDKKLLAAAKRKNTEGIELYHRWMDALFPDGGLQERKDSLSSLYAFFGPAWIQFLFENAEPLQPKFRLVKML